MHRDPHAVRSLDLALTEVEAALDAGDAEAAAAAVVRAEEVTAALSASGTWIPAPDLARLAERHERCMARARTLRATLQTALDDAGRSRRATTAYSNLSR